MIKEPVSSYKGACHCGKVQFEVLGAPLFTQYCHCNKCRSIATKSNREEDKKGYSHTAAYLREKFKITTSDNYLERLPINNSYLYLCKICKSLIYGISQDKQQKKGIGINMSNFSFNTPNIPDIFKSVRHAYYADRIIDIYDFLPKFVNFPSELGGSGQRCK